MSESESIEGEARPALVTESRDTAGAMLRAAREKSGLHIAALAVAIKIPVKKLEALEADQLHGTHDVVFTRALASSVCRALKIDAKPILDALPQTMVRELHVDDNGINAPFSVASAGHSKPLRENLLQPRVLLVLALCVGAVLIFASGWWGQDEGRPAVAAVAEDVTSSQVMAPVVIPAASLSESSVEAKVNTVPVASPTSAVEPVLVSSAPTVQPIIAPLGAQVVAPVSGTPVRNEPKSPGTPSPAVPGSELVMSFKAKHQPVWVEVVDANGEIRLRRNVGAGEKVECGGVLPLVVVIGRADSVDVEVRGKPFNFAPFAKDNVARFEVK